jgi:hypothetical protein
MSMSKEIRVTLIRKTSAMESRKNPSVTADELSKAMSARARKILNGEPVEPIGRRLNSY